MKSLTAKEERAMLVAQKAHSNQFYGIYPYIFHIEEVWRAAKDLNLNEDLRVACILHDVLEDSDLSYNDIKAAFGHKIAETVYAVTDELGRNRKERKEKTYPKIRQSSQAILVKICDRIANVRHSKVFKRDMSNLYKKEERDFKFYLHNSNLETSKWVIAAAWNKLDKLFEE